MKWSLLIILLVAFFAFNLPVHAATITVIPGQSIQSAVTSAASGDTISVQSGTYNESVNISKSNLTLVGNGQVNTKAIDVSGNGNIVRGFTITDRAKTSGIRVTGNNNLIENNEIYHTMQDGIWFFGAYNTFRGNYIHDILDPSITGDPHADCLQTWGWNWETHDNLFEQNTCVHNRATGSNQIVMLENQTVYRLYNITFRNNTFVMYDSGYTPMNFDRKAGQNEISNIEVLNNTIVNMTGNGQAAVNMINITGGVIQGNQVYGYSAVASITGGSVTQSGNNLYPISRYTPAPSPSPAPSGMTKPGDANGDGSVNRSDYVIWLTNYGKTVSAGPASGNFNTDTKVDGLDYVIWLNNYGK